MRAILGIFNNLIIMLVFLFQQVKVMEWKMKMSGNRLRLMGMLEVFFT